MDFRKLARSKISTPSAVLKEALFIPSQISSDPQHHYKGNSETILAYKTLQETSNPEI
jgi:hypothetical protein